MLITKWADAVVRRLVPQTTAGACAAPEPCACGPGVNMCFNGRWQIVYTSPLVYDCKNKCVRRKTVICKVVPAGGPC